jgi:hypothetical protein
VIRAYTGSVVRLYLLLTPWRYTLPSPYSSMPWSCPSCVSATLITTTHITLQISTAVDLLSAKSVSGSIVNRSIRDFHSFNRGFCSRAASKRSKEVDKHTTSQSSYSVSSDQQLIKASVSPGGQSATEGAWDSPSSQENRTIRLPHRRTDIVERAPDDFVHLPDMRRARSSEGQRGGRATMTWISTAARA